MTISSVFLGTSLLALLLGLFLGRITKDKIAGDGNRATALGFAGLGLVLGMALGLSSSPVLGASLAAGITLIGSLIQMYLPKTAAKEEAGGLKPVPVGVWLFPFAASVALGMIVGIELRVNDALDFRSKNLRERFKVQGFDDRQVSDIMDRLSKTIHDPKEAKGVVAEIEEQAKAEKTNLQKFETEMNWTEYWDRVERGKTPPGDVLTEFRKIVPENVQDEIKRLESKSKSAAEIIKTIRQNHPEIGG